MLKPIRGVPLSEYTQRVEEDYGALREALPEGMKAYVRALLPKIEGHGGIAIGTGNQISFYTEPANWIAMTDAVREWRGETV